MENKIPKTIEQYVKDMYEEFAKMRCLKRTGGWIKRAGEKVKCI